jgi:hypothetical protein
VLEIEPENARAKMYLRMMASAKSIPPPAPPAGTEGAGG